MKKYILSALVMLATCFSAGAQTIYFSDGTDMDMSGNRLTNVIFSGKDLILSRQSGDTVMVAFAALDSIDWAEQPNAVPVRLQDDGISIAYLQQTSEIIVSGIEINAQTPAKIYSPEGKFLIAGTNNRFSVADLPAGIYIVSVENKSNAKFRKQ